MPGLKPSPHLGGFALLPPPPDVCQQCAVKHDADQPHNQQSVFWQYHFMAEHGRWPTWADAMAHCSPDIKAMWCHELTKRGVKL